MGFTLIQALAFRHRTVPHRAESSSGRQYKHVIMARELGEHMRSAEVLLSGLSGGERSPESWCKTALRQREKIERYEADLEELQIRLEEQNEVVAEAAEIQRRKMKREAAEHRRS